MTAHGGLQLRETVNLRSINPARRKSLAHMIRLTVFLLSFGIPVLRGQETLPSKQPSSAEEQRQVQAQPQPQKPATPQPQPTKEDQPKTALVGIPQEGSRADSALPWCIAILMAGIAGAAATYILLLTKQDRNFKALRQRVIDGSEPVHLLPEEATRLIREFKEHVTAGARHFDESVKAQRAEVERIVRDAEVSSQEAREETRRTVDTFKASLNGMLESLTKFMEKVVHDTSNAHSQALETKEYAKNVADLIHAKESEIARLKEGYDLHLIAPLTKAFMKIRDDLHAMAPHIKDDQILRHLGDLDHKIVSALTELRIEEIKIPDKPHDLSSRLWESLGAAEDTPDPALHGMRARIKERGYLLKMPNGEPHIIRKAVVVVYSCQKLAEPREQRSTIGIQSEAANDLAESSTAGHPTN